MDSSEENHSSLWMVRAEELFPKPKLEQEDSSLQIPFNELSGESVKYLGKHENGIIALSNYRLFILWFPNSIEVSIPLGLIESVQIQDLFQLITICKDARTFKCSFTMSESCSEWFRRLVLATGIPEQLEHHFAFAFHAWVSEITQSTDQEWYGRLQRIGDYDEDFRRDVERLQFDLQGAWRITYANIDFKLCQSYPKMIIVPACISDDTLQSVASFRSSRRIPAVTWRHKSGAVIARCSQPEVGWLGWRNSKDEQLLKALVDACSFDNGQCIGKQNLKYSTDTAPSSPDSSNPEEVSSLDEPKKILIVDARSYASAVTNRARGGGVECAEYYPSAEIQFMSLGNIHVIRKSFHSLRQLCASPPDIANWYSLLEKTLWLQHLSGLLAASVTVCHAIEKNNRPVMVHCSDGWDRTPQIVATAQLCLDPFYRTIEGFKVLVEKEWLSFGHKFGDRCGHGVGSDETNERCPVFLQWIDCVHQIHRQYPCSFEFSLGYLIKLVQHSHSCLFGTFLCNTMKERLENSIPDRTFSVWPFLSGPMYKNPLFIPNRDKVLWPAYNVRDLAFWSEVYLGNLGNQQNIDGQVMDLNMKEEAPIVKTRSFGDIVSEVTLNGLTRRSSDPSMTVENSTVPHNISNEDSIELNDSHPSSVDEMFLTSVIQDTTQKLQELTHELNESVDDCDGNIVNGSQINDSMKETETCASIQTSPNNFWNKSEIETSTDTLVPATENQSLSLTESNLSLLKNEIKCDLKVKMKESDNKREGVCDGGDKNMNRFENLPQVHLHRKCSNRDAHEVSKESSSDDMVFQIDVQTEGNTKPFANGFKTVNHRYNSSMSCKIIDANDSVSSTTDSRFSTPGIKSMPFATPPCLLLERNASSHSFSDGLNHALNEQNLRLQQIVYEHKLKEEALQKELHAMRMALLRKNNCQCSFNSTNGNNICNTTSAGDEMHSNDYNLENLSNCSWEAIDERNQALPVLWVPDHAVSRCASCQIEFWLGRRKHHCRRCGNIFCADCSEFFAPLPDETLFQPVRLCGSCFNNINTHGRIQHDDNFNSTPPFINHNIAQEICLNGSTIENLQDCKT